jgi:hypothetical protein
MNATRCIRSTIRWLASGVGLAAAAYATYVGTTWCRYGHARHEANREDTDPLLDRFIPEFEVVERHQVRVAAPAEITWSAACDTDLQESAIVRGIFKVRELILGSGPGEIIVPRGLLAQMKAWGWGVLAEIPGREIVFGAATQPWLANVVFRALPAEEFGAFQEPGYVKIVWMLRADPIGAAESVVRTETRVVTTDSTAWAKFRWYWSFFSPGIVLIRRVSLGLVKAEAQRRAREARSEWRTAELLGCPRR